MNGITVKFVVVVPVNNEHALNNCEKKVKNKHFTFNNCIKHLTNLLLKSSFRHDRYTICSLK